VNNFYYYVVYYVCYKYSINLIISYFFFVPFLISKLSSFGWRGETGENKEKEVCNGEGAMTWFDFLV